MKQSKGVKTKPKAARKAKRVTTWRKVALASLAVLILGVLFFAFIFFSKAGRDFGSRIPYVNKIYAYFFLTPKVPDADAYGIDVSHYQGRIDWPSVSLIPYDLTTHIQGRDESSAAVSIGFVMIKATEGTNYVDDCLLSNMGGARSAGFLVGAYHVMTPSDANAQADNFISNSGLVKGDMAPVIDLEESILGGCVPKARKVLKSLVRRLEKRYGTKPIIYCGYKFSSDFHLADDYPDYPLWVAIYGSPIRPSGADFWQFTDRGTIPGVKEKIDLNAFYCKRFLLSDLRVRK